MLFSLLVLQLDAATWTDVKAKEQFVVKVNGLLKKFPSELQRLLADWFGAVLNRGPLESRSIHLSRPPIKCEC